MILEMSDIPETRGRHTVARREISEIVAGMCHIFDERSRGNDFLFLWSLASSLGALSVKFISQSSHRAATVREHEDRWR